MVPDPEANPGLVEDCRVLLGLRDELAGSAGLNWNETLPIGRWEGVFLEGSPPRVYSVAPDGVRLTGRLPADLGKLTALRSLDLEDRLTGPIPPELGNLKQLEFLNLEGNYLSGPIPPELGGLANVERLDVADNLLTGSIPPELGSLTKLEVLDLSVNFLSGPIPPELSALEKLDSFHAQWNELSEPIPPELAGLKEVTRLDLRWNELRGAYTAGAGRPEEPGGAGPNGESAYGMRPQGDKHRAVVRWWAAAVQPTGGREALSNTRITHGGCFWRGWRRSSFWLHSPVAVGLAGGTERI